MISDADNTPETISAIGMPAVFVESSIFCYIPLNVLGLDLVQLRILTLFGGIWVEIISITFTFLSSI